MSEPWLRVYAADMRGDPKVAELGLAGQMLLIHAWDIAKHSPTFGDLRNAANEPYNSRKLAAAIPGLHGHTARKWWSKVVAVGLAEETDDGTLRFPALARRQGYDPTNAERQRRFRKRQRHGQGDADVTPTSNASARRDVTRQSPESRTEREEASNDAPSQDPVVEQARPRAAVDAVWKAYAEHHPRSVLSQRRRKLIRKRLGAYPLSTLLAAIEGNHLDPHCNGENDRGQEYHDLELILRDEAHIERYAAIAEKQQRNGRPAVEDMQRISERAIRGGYRPAHPTPDDQALIDELEGANA